MKNYLLLFFLLISSISLGQKSIIGNWKIVSINNGEIYYNFQKDSLLVFPEFGETNLDSLQLNQIKSMTKLAYGSTKFSFNTNGDYRWEYTPTIGVSGKFSVDEKKQIIKLNDQNSLGETITDEFSYEIKNGQLEITIGFSEPPGKYVLEKM